MQDYRDFLAEIDRKSTRLNSSHGYISYAVFCLKKKKNQQSKNHGDERGMNCAADCAGLCSGLWPYCRMCSAISRQISAYFVFGFFFFFILPGHPNFFLPSPPPPLPN